MFPADPLPVETNTTSRPAPVWLRLPTFPVRATNVLLAVLVAVWLYEYTRGASDNGDVLLTLGAKSNYEIVVHHDYLRLVWAMFLHADWLHIAFNGYALLIFGQQVE